MVTKSKKTYTNADAYQALVDHFGGVSKFGVVMGQTRQTTSRWRKYGIPAKYLPTLIKLTGWPPNKIFPDLFP